VPLRTRAYSGLLSCLGFLFEPSTSHHQSPLSAMTDGTGPSSRPTPADRQHSRFRRPDLGPPARFVSEEEYNRWCRPCCEYCHRAQDVSTFYFICPSSCPCPWATSPGLEPGFAWGFNFEVQYSSKMKQRRYERRLCSICRLVKGLVIVQLVECPPWCMCPWGVKEPLTSILFSGTNVTETWYDHEASPGRETPQQAPQLGRRAAAAQRTRSLRDAVEGRKQRAAAAALVMAV